MSSLSLLVLLLFTVSSHACTARPLTIKPSANCHFHQEVEKDKDKVKLLETITTTSSNLKGKQVVYDSCSSTSSTWKQMVVVDGPSGESFQKDSPSSLAIKEERRHEQTRSMLGPASHHSQETEEEEAIVEMDYAQPHRKPPIHNDKP
ncbi:hypothetical protein HN51_007828 [Arachis hypogaea]|uniref:Uncharacterized protein n=2 Tax=Arachis TaxID=3817 RepID=A0A445D5Z3_ARAHY|nr:uncharacterized protein LOC107488146 [Arachis duranensis]XP_025697526.1 uncharacterized protein LOC112799684 [Arachis hypogaea]QHO42053.1 uncharacterized protein DS421_5g150920 [Arachis hypogaea]RYR58667.1 hypothetical protein Ahy_A05g024558 [Arachis hypogaea]